jgi:hypothetical protein
VAIINPSSTNERKEEIDGGTQQIDIKRPLTTYIRPVYQPVCQKYQRFWLFEQLRIGASTFCSWGLKQDCYREFVDYTKLSI